MPTALLVAPTLAHPGMAAPRRQPPWAMASVVAVIVVALGLALRQGADGTQPPKPQALVSPSPVSTITPLPPASTPTPTSTETPEASRATPSPVKTSRSPAAPTKAPPQPVRTPSPVPLPAVTTAAPTPVPTPVPPPSATPIPVAEPGQLQVAVRPWAEVMIDGRVLGTTPLDKLTLEPGSHLVVLRHPAYEELRRDVVVKSGETVRLIVDLSKEGSPRR